MKYYDITALPDIDVAFWKRLGYSKIYTRNEVRIEERQNGTGAYILKSSEPGRIFRSISDRNCVGIVFRDNLPVKRVLEKAAAEDKPVIIPISKLTCSTGPSFMKNTYGLKSIFASCVNVGVTVAAASLAANADSLLSSLQMLELSKFIGASEEQAKEMISHRWIE